MFTTKVLTLSEIQGGALDRWLNSLRKGNRAVRLAHSIGLPESPMHEAYVVVTAVTWQINESASRPNIRATIDEIPEEPTIDVTDTDV